MALLEANWVFNTATGRWVPRSGKGATRSQPPAVDTRPGYRYAEAGPPPACIRDIAAKALHRACTALNLWPEPPTHWFGLAPEGAHVVHQSDTPLAGFTLGGNVWLSVDLTPGGLLEAVAHEAFHAWVFRKGLSGHFRDISDEELAACRFATNLN
jgi:hypothetical protein